MKALKLCLLIDSLDTDESLKRLLAAIKGGVSCVQLRNKSEDLNKIAHNAIQLLNLLKPLQIPLIINDHVEIAKEVKAQGVHLGQKDTNPIEAREKLGKDALIGLSVETLDELYHANELNVINYIAASAVFSTKSKSNCRTIWGLTGLANIVKNSKHPVVAIGGINSSNVKNVIATGACGIAVISAIHDASDPYYMSNTLINEIYNAEKDRRDSK